MTSPLVSVVIPTYNSARWIEQALSSVLAQRSVSLEIVIGDSGSTDGTTDIIRRIAPNARIAAASVKGPSTARNSALASVRGTYVQFLDSDDLIAPDKISSQVDVLERSGAGVAWGGFHEIAEESTPEQIVRLRYRQPQIGDDVARDVIGLNGFLQLGAALFRNDVRFQRIRFDPDCTVVEDVRFLIELASAGTTFVQSGGPSGFFFREHKSDSRASQVDPSIFYAACASNAALLLDRSYDTSGVLDVARRDAVVESWLQAAERFAEHRDAQLRPLLSRIEALDPAWQQRVRRPYRSFVRVVGYGNTFAIARAVKRLLARTPLTLSAGVR